jgi:DNA-binding protein HU-beta
MTPSLGRRRARRRLPPPNQERSAARGAPSAPPRAREKTTESRSTRLVGVITKHLKKGERIRIAGLSIPQVRKRAARMGRNPATGEAIKIKASKKVAFRAAKDLKMAV